MKLYVGVTDNEWFDYLSSLQPLDEVKSGINKIRFQRMTK